MDAGKALVEAGSFIKNAEEELERKILREDQLYFVDNQVEAIDAFLADTEDLQDGSADLAAARTRLRSVKQQLERKGVEFMASQGGEALPEDLPPEEQIPEFVSYAKDFVKMADDALKEKVASVEDLPLWEEPLRTIKSFLADSEPLAMDKDLARLRAELKGRKGRIEVAITEVLKKWRESDLVGGKDDGEGE